MAIVRFRPFSQSMDDPFRDVTDIQGQMNRLFDNLLGDVETKTGSPFVFCREEWLEYSRDIARHNTRPCIRNDDAQPAM